MFGSFKVWKGLGIVGGVEKNWMPLSALWWAVPCLMVWAGGLWKGGWIRI